MKRSRWSEPVRSAGLWGFVLHRISGLLLSAYLAVHLVLLSRLLAGPSAWDAFVGLMRSRVILALDLALLGATVFHGFNGLRLTLLGLGWAVDRQKELFWVCLVFTVILAGCVGARMLSG